MEHQAPGSPKFFPPESKTVQQLVGTFLYYLHTVDPTMIMALNIIVAEQANSTQATAKAVTQLLNYSATHSEAIARYQSSVMVLHIHSDDSLLSDPEADIRAGGYHYLSTKSVDPNNSPMNQPPLNRPVHVECMTMRNVLARATEEELEAPLFNCQIVTAMHMALIEIGHIQPPTTAVMDSVIGDGFSNDNIRQLRSRAIDIRFTGSDT